jgi:hypothetical protein
LSSRFWEIARASRGLLISGTDWLNPDKSKSLRGFEHLDSGAGFFSILTFSFGKTLERQTEIGHRTSNVIWNQTKNALFGTY